MQKRGIEVDERKGLTELFLKRNATTESRKSSNASRLGRAEASADGATE